MGGFLNIERFEFEEKCLKEAYAFLREAGNDSFEAVALFAGEVGTNIVKVTQSICPLQESSRSQFGLMYTVEGEELYRINRWLYKNKLKLIAQIHSHPTEAYHSEMDDAFPIVTIKGGLSIVVPNFAQDNFNHLDWAYYRLDEHEIWSEMDIQKVIKTIKII